MPTYQDPETQPAMTLLYPREEIAARVQALAREIDRDYAGRELLLIGILKGSFLFIADLARALNTPASIDFVRIASYGSETRSSGIVEIRKDLEMPIRGRHVLIVEDILDTGLSLAYLLDKVAKEKPRSLRSCVFINKIGRRKADIDPDFLHYCYSF